MCVAGRGTADASDHSGGTLQAQVGRWQETANSRI